MLIFLCVCVSVFTCILPAVLTCVVICDQTHEHQTLEECRIAHFVEFFFFVLKVGLHNISKSKISKSKSASFL